jgi:hypothetical protein
MFAPFTEFAYPPAEMKLIALILLFGASALAGDFAWQDNSTYRPPNFDANFADDPEAAKLLETIVPALERGQPPTNSFELLRNGLRHLRRDLQMSTLRGFGNSYIWNKSPQNPEAIDLMYHAAGSTNREISYNAIYFGISTVRPMTQPILRALVDIGMNTEDPNTLSRIVWAGSANKADLARYLQPHLDSLDPKRRERAEDLAKIFSGELNAFVWAEAHAKSVAAQKFTDRLPELRETLLTGNSAARRETFDFIDKERIALIIDDSFIPAFEAAASDSDPKVRKAATITISRWIWTDTPSPAGIDLIQRLSHDVSREVRYNAMYYGLSGIHKRSETVIERLLEMTFQDGLDDGDFRGHATTSLRDDKKTLARVLQNWMQGADPVRALFAYGFYLDTFAAQPELPTTLTSLLENTDKIIAHALAFRPTKEFAPKSMEGFFIAVRDQLPAPYNDRILWPSNEGPPFIIVTESEKPPLQAIFEKSDRIKLAYEIDLPVEAVVHIGKTGSLKTYPKKLRPR